MDGSKRQGVSGLVTIAATIFLVSAGLCGATWFISDGGGSPMLMGFGVLELVGMVAGLAGLFVAALLTFVDYFRSWSKKDSQ